MLNSDISLEGRSVYFLKPLFKTNSEIIMLKLQL